MNKWNINESRKSWLVYICFSILIVLPHLFIQYTNDDLTIAAQISDWESVFKRIAGLYISWEGSWFCQFIMSVVLKYIWIFRPLNILVCIWIVYSISRLLPGGGNTWNKEYITMTFFLFYPLGSVSTAGWVVTSIAYLWIVAGGLYGLVLTKRYIDNTHITKKEYILGSLAMVFGANREQSGLFLIIVLTGVIVYQYITKGKRLKYLWIQAGLILFSWLSVMLSPGVKAKNMVYATKAYPSIGMLTFPDKILRVLSDTFNYFINEYQFIIMILVIVIAYKVLLRYKDCLARGIALFPCCYSFLIYIKPWKQLEALYKPSIYFALETVNDMKTYIPFLLQVCWVGCILASLWLIYDNTRDFWMLLIVLIAGMATRVGTAVSAAIVPSGTRQSIFFYFALIYCTTYLVAGEEKLMESKTLRIILGMIGIFCVLNLTRALMVYGGIIPHYLDRY